MDDYAHERPRYPRQSFACPIPHIDFGVVADAKQRMGLLQVEHLSYRRCNLPEDTCDLANPLDTFIVAYNLMVLLTTDMARSVVVNGIYIRAAPKSTN